MRVGVVKAMFKNLGEDQIRAAHGEVVTIDTEAVQARQVLDRHPRQTLHCQHPPGGLRPVDQWNDDVPVAGELTPKRGGVTSFLLVVEFPRSVQANSLTIATTSYPTQRRSPLAVCAMSKQTQVDLDLRDDSRLLHLDDDFLTGEEPGGVDLTDRGGRQGLVVEAGEYLGDGTAELALDHLTDRRGGHRGNAVTELGQFVDIGGRQEIGAGGKNLSQLDRRRPELFQRQPEVIGARVCLIARGVTQPPLCSGSRSAKPKRTRR